MVPCDCDLHTGRPKRNCPKCGGSGRHYATRAGEAELVRECLQVIAQRNKRPGPHVRASASLVGRLQSLQRGEGVASVVFSDMLDWYADALPGVQRGLPERLRTYLAREQRAYPGA